MAVRATSDGGGGFVENFPVRSACEKSSARLAGKSKRTRALNPQLNRTARALSNGPHALARAFVRFQCLNNRFDNKFECAHKPISLTHTRRAIRTRQRASSQMRFSYFKSSRSRPGKRPSHNRSLDGSLNLLPSPISTKIRFRYARCCCYSRPWRAQLFTHTQTQSRSMSPLRHKYRYSTDTLSQPGTQTHTHAPPPSSQTPCENMPGIFGGGGGHKKAHTHTAIFRRMRAARKTNNLNKIFARRRPGGAHEFRS